VFKDTRGKVFAPFIFVSAVNVLFPAFVF